MDKLNTLTPNVLAITREKGTELPHSGEYNLFEKQGVYLCRQCGLALYRSDDKFISQCGWPSFDSELPETIHKSLDADGVRTEILCHRCHAHLGHLFKDEKLTEKNKRYCVNSVAIEFVPDINVVDSEEAIYAAGCFWGVQYYIEKLDGVLKTEVGYTGGTKENPTYREVCQGSTGHFEAVRVLYDPKKLNYESLTKYFFEIHDPTQRDGQGPDRGNQYLSAIFFIDADQQKVAEKLVTQLEALEYRVATRILKAKPFWKAERDHQNYYENQGTLPYCHTRVKRFD